MRTLDGVIGEILVVVVGKSALKGVFSLIGSDRGEKTVVDTGTSD